MSSYFIFAIALTVAYIIYFAVMIMQDLYGKKKDGKNDVEVFSVTDDPDEGVQVSESDSGFSIGEEDYTTEYLEQENAPTVDENQESSTDSPSPIAEIKSQIDEAMDNVESFMSNPCTDEKLQLALINGGHIDDDTELDWKKVINEL